MERVHFHVRVGVINLRRWQTRTHCCGNIVAHDVSLHAQTGKHLLRTQNVSEQNQKHFCVPDTKFVSATNEETFVSATMCRQQCILVCQYLYKIFFRHLLCRDAATVFANAIRLLKSRVFLQQSKILYCEINYTRSSETSNNTEIKNINRYIKRYRNFADYLCCLPIFPAKLLICSQTLISLKRI